MVGSMVRLLEHSASGPSESDGRQGEIKDRRSTYPWPELEWPIALRAGTCNPRPRFAKTSLLCDTVSVRDSSRHAIGVGQRLKPKNSTHWNCWWRMTRSDRWRDGARVLGATWDAWTNACSKPTSRSLAASTRWST